MHDRRAALLILAAAAAALALPAPASAARLTDLGSFSQPVYTAAPPGDSSRLMVVQKEGVIRVLRGGVQSTFLDVAAAVGGVESVSEQGLLSMAFAPDYGTSGRFYVYYTAAGGDSNNVDEFTVSSDRSVANPASRRPVISIPHPTAGNHNGGQVAFGPDGMLYLAPGDGGVSSSDAQDTTKLVGKLLRIDPRSGSPYAIPPGNPYAGATPGADEIYHVGLRNPYRFSFDRLTGDLMIGDVGAGSAEEVDLVPRGTPAGRNFGWPICEASCGGTAPPANYFGPALQYSQGSPRAVTGGVVVRDASLPELYGCYLYGDFYDGQIRATGLAPQADAGHGPPIGLRIDGLSSFSEDNAGHVYVTALTGGHVYRLDGAGAPSAACASGVPGVTQDRQAPGLRTKTKRRQRVRRLGGVVVYARCTTERCTVSLSALLRVGKRSYPLKGVRKSAAKGKRVRLKAKLTRRSGRALRKGLKRGATLRVKVTLRAEDAAGNRTRAHRATVRVAR